MGAISNVLSIKRCDSGAEVTADSLPFDKVSVAFEGEVQR